MSSRGPSLEDLVESGALETNSYHPGGLALTTELADLCGIAAGTRVLDVACGTGESACHLAERGAWVCGLDHSVELLARARDKAADGGLTAVFCQADAHALPFADAGFDAVICECTLCLLDKSSALEEMVRVTRPGGRVGIHDLFWQSHARERLKRLLAEFEDEYPETLAGWQQLFAAAGLVDVRSVDRSQLKQRWMRDTRRQLGLGGQLALVRDGLRRWGLAGVWRLIRSERVFASRQLGYAMIVGVRP